MEAISIMAKTSKKTRNNLFPALMHCLAEPPDYALGTIAQGMWCSRNAKTTHLHFRTHKAISLSGFEFVSNGQEAELLYIVE
jgi:hypothetical protein